MRRRYIVASLAAAAAAAGFALALDRQAPSLPIATAVIPVHTQRAANAAYKRAWTTFADHEDHRLILHYVKRHEISEEVLARLPLEPGMTVVDLGCGAGVYTFSFARAVGPSGRVLALDIERAAVEQVEARLADRDRNPYGNVIPLLTAPDDPGLEPASVDLVFMAHLGFVVSRVFLPENERLLRRVHDALSPEGILAILQWDRPGTDIGRVSPNVTSFGFELQEEHRLDFAATGAYTDDPAYQQSRLFLFRRAAGAGAAGTP